MRYLEYNLIMSITSIKNEFPIFKNHPRLVYFDNAATTQKPQYVLDAVNHFYTNSNANIARGSYPLAAQAEVEYLQSKTDIANFVNASVEEILITSGCTDSINKTVQLLEINKWICADCEIIVTEMEHHSNFLPWQQLAKRVGAIIKMWPVDEQGELERDWLEKNITQKTAVLAITHISNSLGTINAVQEVADLIRKHGQKTPFGRTLLIVDGAQAVAHHNVNVRELGADFYAFSGHKMYASMGVGLLFAKSEILQQLTPTEFGGGAVEYVRENDVHFVSSTEKFQPGTPNIAGAVSLAAAARWLQKNHQNRELDIAKLTEYAAEKLQQLKNIEIIGLPNKYKSGIISFTVNNNHPLDIGSMLGIKGIAIRTGSHCNQILMKKLQQEAGTCRISFGLYNTKEEIDFFVQELKLLLI